MAEPNEALIISGLREKGIVKDASGDEMGFRIVTGKGTMVVPGVQAVRRLSLDLHAADLQVDCVTHQGIPVHVSGPPVPRPARQDGPADATCANGLANAQALMEVASSGMAGFEFLRGLFVPKAAATAQPSMPAPVGAADSAGNGASGDGGTNG